MAHLGLLQSDGLIGLAARQRTRNAPRLPTEFDDVDTDRLHDGARWERVQASGDHAGITVHDVAWTESHFTDLRLTGSTLIGVTLTDVCFERCELSGTVLRDAALKRVEFRECRMSGVGLAEASLRDVRFVGCKLDDANFRRVRADWIEFDDCLLRAAELTNATLANASLHGSDLTGADVSSSDLRGASLRGSTLDGLKGAEHLRGVTIDLTQVLDLSAGLFHALNITVDDGGGD